MHLHPSLQQQSSLRPSLQPKFSFSINTPSPSAATDSLVRHRYGHFRKQLRRYILTNSNTLIVKRSSSHCVTDYTQTHQRPLSHARLCHFRTQLHTYIRTDSNTLIVKLSTYNTHFATRHESPIARRTVVQAASAATQISYNAHPDQLERSASHRTYNTHFATRHESPVARRTVVQAASTKCLSE